jgi:hypothetical protein
MVRRLLARNSLRNCDDDDELLDLCDSMTAAEIDEECKKMAMLIANQCRRGRMEKMKKIRQMMMTTVVDKKKCPMQLLLFDRS